MRKLLHALAVMATVGLSGCFVSDEPIITTTNADYPFGQVTHWLTFDGPNSNVVTSESDVILKDGYYEAGSGNDRARYLFKALDASFYVMQMSEPYRGGARGAIYSLLRIDGKILYGYNNQCSDLTAQMFSATGAIERVTTGGGSPRNCHVRDLDGLTEIFNSLKGEEPEGKVIVQ